MSINIAIPLQSINYLTTANIFSANFNTPTVGKYNFGVAANQGQTVIELAYDTQYLIERMFISGDITEAAFLDSLDPANIPKLFLSRRKAGAVIHSGVFPITQFVQNREAPIFIYSDKKDDALLVSFSGIINQVAATVGKTKISLSLNLSIYQVAEKGYSIGMRTAVEPAFGDSIRKR